MRWAIIGTRGIPARYGGFETAVEETAVRLAARGHTVRVYGRRHFMPDEPSEYHGVKLVWLPAWPHNHLETVVHASLSILHVLLRRVDFVHIYSLGSAPLVPLLRLMGIPVVVSVDGIEARRRSFGVLGRFWMRLSEYMATHLASAVIVYNPVVETYWRGDHSPRRLRMIHYGADVHGEEEAGPLPIEGLERGRFILFVGRFVPEKQIELLIEGYRRAGLDWPLVLVGGNPRAPEYVESLKRMAGDGVRFYPALYGAPIRDLLSGCGIFAQCSELEGTSPAILQAMGCGCAVVVNGIEENCYTVGEAGVLFNHNDPEDLARVLRELAGDEARRRSLGQQARERVRTRFDWDSVTDELETLAWELSPRKKGSTHGT